jgi:NAD(P)-dependent dehydrogenase (short-subunit alcohol dehydrogenase family)/acyl dehydratase
METKASFTVRVEPEDVRRFAALSGDHSPLHVDQAYCATTEFGRPIAHGALLAGFVSRMLGMHIPGRRSVILSMNLRFPKPVLYPTELRVEGELAGFHATRNSGTVKVQIFSGDAVVLDGTVNFALHAGSAHDDAPAELDPGSLAPGPVTAGSTVQLPGTRQPAPDTPTRRLLVTGGTGGIGSELVARLALDYAITCTTRTPREDAGVVDYLQADLESDDDVERLLAALSPADFHGIVHLSAPSVKRALLTADPVDNRRHWRHAVEVPVLLGRWAQQRGSAVRRIVLFGSTYGTKAPDAQLGAYSLAKAATEHVARLMMWDLSAQKATVNVVVPGFVPLGMNNGVLDAKKRQRAARIPHGRLVMPDDLAGVVSFLLSEESAQINGTSIVVDGGAQ